MKRLMVLVVLAIVAPIAAAHARSVGRWTELVPDQSYAVQAVERTSRFVLVATRGETLAEPVVIAFYVSSSPACGGPINPTIGPRVGGIGIVGVIGVAGATYSMDGACDGDGNLIMTPAVWGTRQVLLQAVENTPVLGVRFYTGSGFELHYETQGFNKVLAALSN